MNPDSVSAQVPDIADGVSESTKASTTEVQTITSRKRKKTNAQRCREYRERKKLQNTMVQNITAERSDECRETDQLPAKKPKTDAERRKKYYEAQKLKKQKSKKIPKTAKQRNKECYDRKKKFQALNTLNHHSDVWRTWITDIGRKDLLKKRSCYKYRVCSTHFPDAMLKNKRLKPDAVPCINLPGMTSSPTSPISSTNENMDELVDKSAMIKTEQDCEEIQMKQSENSGEEDDDSKMHIKEELIEQQQVQPQTWQIAPRSEQLYLQVGPIIQQPIRSRVDYDAHAGPSNHQPSNIKIETEDIEVFTNQFDIFGRYIALQLKSLHEADAALAQMEIQKVLTRYRNSFNNNSDENDECAFPMHSDNIPSELILKVEPESDTVFQ